MNITRVMPFVLDSGEDVEIQITVTDKADGKGHSANILLIGSPGYKPTAPEESRAGMIVVGVIEEAKK